jgi:glycosyltransferase involved in cell wall biosynthesis
MTAPRLSVLIANYNHGHYLSKCFAGLLAQTFTDFEILITDDGSTDGSPEIIADYAKKDARFKPEYFPANRGLVAASANLFGRVSGRYLYSGAADDFVINKDFFQKAVTTLEQDKRPAGFYGINRHPSGRDGQADHVLRYRRGSGLQYAPPMCGRLFEVPFHCDQSELYLADRPVPRVLGPRQ